LIKKLLRLLLVLILVAAIALTVFWFARPADVSFDEVRASVPNSAYSHFAEIDGVRVHYQEKGAGTPLLLIHGLNSSTYTWKDVFEPLAKSYRVIAVDLKGFGFSGKPDGDYTRRAQAILVAHLLDYLKIEKVWLAGNSMGGEVALNFALQNPQRTAGLILIDSAGINSSNSLVPAYARIPFVGPILAALALTSDRLVRHALERSFYDGAKVTDERVAAYYRPLKTRGGQLAALRARSQWGLFPIAKDLNKISSPALIIWGAEDALIPIETGRRLNSLIKDSKLVIIEKCGHVPQEELPERVLDEMTKFIAGSNQATDRMDVSK
jgi:pimeloyl-ACP methyl ester carboxylesterase